MNTIKEYIHKPSGNIYKKGENYYHHKLAEINNLSVPSYIVESGNDWEEVKPKEPIVLIHVLDQHGCPAIGKRGTSGFTDKEIEVMEHALSPTEICQGLNKEALNGETYSKDRVYELLRDLADQTIFMTPNDVSNINSWVQNWFESVEQKRIIEEQSKINSI